MPENPQLRLCNAIMIMFIFQDLSWVFRIVLPSYWSSKFHFSMTEQAGHTMFAKLVELPWTTQRLVLLMWPVRLLLRHENFLYIAVFHIRTMAELGIIASVAQIADLGVRLSLRLYTFGETVASADNSISAISKDVSLTSSVLRELGQTLEKDQQSRLCSQNALETADGIVKECFEIFQSMDKSLAKSMSRLGLQNGQRGAKTVAALERLKWPFLQPKMQLLRSNLERLKSTLLLMLNVLTYARQVADK